MKKKKPCPCQRLGGGHDGCAECVKKRRRFTDKDRLSYVLKFVERRDLWNALMDHLIAASPAITYRQAIDTAMRQDGRRGE